MTFAQRHGGALYPVLMMATILVILSAMLPQVLVQASTAMRNGNDRQAVLYACESGIAMAEARIKRQLASDLQLGQPPSLDKLEVSPTMENPDYGRKQDIDFSVRLTGLKLRDVLKTDQGEIYRYSYGLDAKAWTPKARAVHLAVQGLISLPLTIDRHGGGMPLRAVGPATINAINREEND
jgi:hypothetical protein